MQFAIGAALRHAQIRPRVLNGARGMLEVGFGIQLRDELFGSLRDVFYDKYELRLCLDS